MIDMATQKEHAFKMYIPMNKKGEEDLEYMRFDSPNVKDIDIDKGDIDNCWNVIFELNDKLSLLIDIYEDETIPAKQVSEALTICRSFLAGETDNKKISAIQKIIGALELANTYNSPLLLWW